MGKTNEAYIRKILTDLQKIDYIRPEEVPNIDLYMDQVTTFMDEHLMFCKRYPEDKLLTKTMINNYTKNNLLPSPQKKKYTKEHMLLLVFIYYFKSFLSINDIQSILTPLTDKFFTNEGDISLEDLYKEIFRIESDMIDGVAKDIIRKFANSKKAFESVTNEEDHDYLTNFAFICMLSFDVYVKKQAIERLIDTMNEDQASKDNKGNKTAKENKGKKEHNES